MTRPWIRARRMVIAAAFAGSVVYAWRHRAPSPKTETLPVLPDGIRYQSSDWTAQDWLREGYAEMVSPIRPPSTEDGRTRITVYLRMPPQSRIRLVKSLDGWTFEVPDGTIACRVEFYGDGPRDAIPSATWRVLDVRGISFTRSAQEFRVLRPKFGMGHDLFGIAWPRGDKQDAANTALGELVLRGLVAGPAEANERERAAAHLRGLNDCASCHEPQRQGRRTEHDPGIVNRGIDASGFFQVASIFRNRLSFETYRPHDMNRGDPFIARTCSGRRVDDALPRCPDGTILEGELNVREGIARGDVHTQRVCASRRALAAHFEEDARSVFGDALAECSAPPAASSP